MTKLRKSDQERRVLCNRSFSEDFKRKKVREIECNLVTISEISKTYLVSRNSIYRWIYKYSLMAKKNVKQVVEAKSDTQKIRMLEDRIKELERIIGQKQLAIEFKDKMIEIAENTYGVDIKKKVGSKLSSGTSITGRNAGEK